MNRVFLACVTTVTLFVMSASPCLAVLSMELSSSDDLLNLTIGDTATIDVRLAGLDPAAGERLTTLVGSVVFPDTIFTTPSNVTAGPIVPNPADFFDVVDPGLADGTFLTFSFDSGDHITSNGLFFSFDVTAIAVGSGVFMIDEVSISAEQFNVGDPDNPILRVDLTGGEDLPFAVVSPGDGAVPEPVTLGLSLLAGATLVVPVTRRGGRCG